MLLFLLPAPQPGPPVDLNTMADLFLQRNMVREATAFLLDVLQVRRGVRFVNAAAAAAAGISRCVSRGLASWALITISSSKISRPSLVS